MVRSCSGRVGRLVACAIALATTILCFGCAERVDMLVRAAYSSVTGEEYVSPRAQACLDVTDALLGALEEGDADAIVGLFSPTVRSSSTGLERQARELVEGCSGGVSYVDTHSAERPHESERVDDGQRRVELSAEFSFALGERNYWCFMTLVSEDDFEEAEEGVSTLVVWSEDAYAAMLYDEPDAEWPEGTGLHLRLSHPLAWETRLVDGDPLRYEGEGSVPDVAEAVAFLDEGERTVADFQERFGQPCCVSWTGDGIVYYELPEEDGEPRFLEVSAPTPERPVYSAHVVGERGVVEKVWGADDEA